MDDPGLSLTSLKPFLVFECAARAGSFSGAAKAFNLSQPSVTRNIAQLEKTLGVALFRRGARGSELTRDGEELFRAVSQGLRSISDGVAKVSQRQERDRNVVRLSVSGSFVAHWMGPRLASFTQTFPEVQLRFHLISGLMTEVPQDVDLAIRTVHDPGNEGAGWDFAPEIVLPVCNPDYPARQNSRSETTFLHFSGHARDIWETRTQLGAPGARPGDVCHEFDDYSVLLQAALDGSGIALGWLSVTSKLLLDGRLVSAGDTAYRSGRSHRLIDTSAPAKPVVPRIAEWLCDTMRRDLARLAPVLGSAA